MIQSKTEKINKKAARNRYGMHLTREPWGMAMKNTGRNKSERGKKIKKRS